EQLAEEEVKQKYEELLNGIQRNENETALASPYQSKGRFKSFFSLFIPVEGYWITPMLINLNIAIFILMAASGVSVFSPDGQSMINWGANFRPVTLEGQAWRLFTCCFIHIGIIHLLMNMYALAYIGVLLEAQLGKVRF